MRNFSLKTKKNFRPGSRKRDLVVAALVVLFAVSAVFFLRTILSEVGSIGSEVVFRVREYFVHSTAVFPSYIRSRDELVDTIEDLNRKLAAQSGDASTISRLSHENSELRALVGDGNDERILGGVLARPPLVPYDLLVVDRGSIHGVVLGAPVYHANNHAVGIVSRVYARISLVTLFSSSGVESTVYLYGPNVFAYAYGEGGGVIRVSLPQGVDVTVGDSVVLPSLHMGDVGLVGRVVSLPTQPEQSAYVTFPVPLQSMRTVTIGKEPITLATYDDMVTDVKTVTERVRVSVPESALTNASTTLIETGSTTTSLP